MSCPRCGRCFGWCECMSDCEDTTKQLCPTMCWDKDYHADRCHCRQEGFLCPYMFMCPEPCVPRHLFPDLPEGAVGYVYDYQHGKHYVYPPGHCKFDESWFRAWENENGCVTDLLAYVKGCRSGDKHKVTLDDTKHLEHLLLKNTLRANGVAEKDCCMLREKTGRRCQCVKPKRERKVVLKDIKLPEGIYTGIINYWCRPSAKAGDDIIVGCDWSLRIWSEGITLRHRGYRVLSVYPDFAKGTKKPGVMRHSGAITVYSPKQEGSGFDMGNILNSLLAQILQDKEVTAEREVDDAWYLHDVDNDRDIMEFDPDQPVVLTLAGISYASNQPHGFERWNSLGVIMTSGEPGSDDYTVGVVL